MLEEVLDRLWFVFTGVVPAIVVGVALANVIVELGLMRYVTAFTKPLTRGANLPDEAGSAILTCLASPAAGYSMLADYREKGRLDDRQTLISVVINTFPGAASHLFKYYLPVVIPILGFEAGVLYVGARMGIALSITVTGLLAGRFLLERPESFVLESDEEDDRGRREKVREGLEKSYDLLRRILVRIVAAYVVVSFILASGAMERVKGYAEPFTEAAGFEAEVAAVAATRLLDVTSSFVVAGSFLDEGSLLVVQAVVALLVGGLLSLTVNTFKSSIPFQFSIWGSEFGTKVVVLNLVLKLFYIGVFVGLFLAFT